MKIVISISFVLIVSIQLFGQDSRVVTENSSDLPDMKIIDITKEKVGVFLKYDSTEIVKKTKGLQIKIIDTIKRKNTPSNLMKVKKGKIENFQTTHNKTSIVIFYENDKQRGGVVVENEPNMKIYNKDSYEIIDRQNEKGRLKLLHFLIKYRGTALELPSLDINSKLVSENDTINSIFTIFIIARDKLNKIHHIFITPKNPIITDDLYYSVNLLTEMLNSYVNTKNLNLISSLMIPGFLKVENLGIDNKIFDITKSLNLNEKEIQLHYYFW